MWYGSFIELIWFNYQSLSDPNKTFDATMGGWGGETKEFFHLGRDEAIVAIRGWYGLFVDSLNIETINIYTGKKKVHAFGGLGGTVEYRYRDPRPPLPPTPPRGATGRYGDRGALGRRWAVRGLDRSHPTTPVSVVARPLYEHRISLFTELPTRGVLGNSARKEKTYAADQCHPEEQSEPYTEEDLLDCGVSPLLFVVCPQQPRRYRSGC